MYYPDQRYVSALTVIQRRCMLPDTAIGSIRVKENARVDVHDVVANGVIPARYYLLDALRFFKLRKLEKLNPLLLVAPGDIVQEKEVLAGKNRNRGKRLLAPVRGIVKAIENGRIILQAMPAVIDIEAGVRGRVVRTFQDRGVAIETTGARVQGVWGNDRTLIATLRLAPKDNIEDLPDASLGVRYSGATLLTRNPLTERALKKMEDKGLAGVIAPSMDTDLIEHALAIKGAIMLTEGFGDMRMGQNVFSLLSEFDGHQAIVDAHLPNRWEVRAPEVIINLAPKEGEIPARPNVMLTLREGMNVRVTRAPYAGLTGLVAELPESPILLGNGLRIRCARVELVIGEIVFVPLTNIEVLGR